MSAWLDVPPDLLTLSLGALFVLVMIVAIAYLVGAPERNDLKSKHVQSPSPRDDHRGPTPLPEDHASSMPERPTFSRTKNKKVS